MRFLLIVILLLIPACSNVQVVKQVDIKVRPTHNVDLNLSFKGA